MKRSISCLIGLASVGFLGVVACDEESTSTPGIDAGTITPVIDSGSAAPRIECPTSLGPTTHEGGYLDASETWKAENSPHIVTSDLVLRQGATLTLEPCVEVQVAKGRHIEVGKGTGAQGHLVAVGDANRPVRITARDAEPWASVTIGPGSTARLAFVTLEKGGAGDFQDNATINVLGDGTMPADDMLYVDHVTIKQSVGTGIWMQRGANFIPGSKDLTITESGSDEFPYPIEIEEHTIDRLPTGKYTGNKKDEILLGHYGTGTAGAGLVVDTTMHDRGVPYHMGRSKLDDIIIGEVGGSKVTTLTIEAGTVLKFEDETALKIQGFTTDEPSKAALRALGTADKPVVFTSARANPVAGSWRGLWFGGIADASNRLDHVRIEYAGDDCSCSLNTCSAITASHGAVIFTNQVPSAFITNSTIKASAGHGITQGYAGRFVDFLETNTFEDLVGCKQTRPMPTDGSCPSPRPSCMEE